MVSWYRPQTNLFEIVIGKSCSLVHFGILKHFGNIVRVHSGTFLTMGTVFPHVSLKMTHGTVLLHWWGNHLPLIG